MTGNRRRQHPVRQVLWAGLPVLLLALPETAHAAGLSNPFPEWPTWQEIFRVLPGPQRLINPDHLMDQAR